ncbi:TetR/AcrR family transcriptional regulator [Leucobacter sp. GX0328]
MATQKIAGRGESFTEQARRAQLIGITRNLIAERGHRGTSLQSIADAAGITKAAVLYYFPTKAAVIEAAYGEVVAALARDVGAAVEAAALGHEPAAYIRAMVHHLHEHPQHTRIFAEAVLHDERPHSRKERWQPLAALIETAAGQDAVDARDARATAIIIGGAIDGIIAEQLDDPDFDSGHAAEVLIAMLPGASNAATES